MKLDHPAWVVQLFCYGSIRARRIKENFYFALPRMGSFNPRTRTKVIA